MLLVHFGGKGHTRTKGIEMSLTIRRGILAAGAAALISAQAAYAAPAQNNSLGLDPLVALSILSSSQSGGAVCPSGTVPAAASAAALAAGQAAPVNCVLPVTGVAATPPVGQAVPPPPMMPMAGPAKSMGALPMLLGMALLVGLAAAILSGGQDGEGNLTPISPQ